MKAIGIDIGTTSICTVVIDTEGKKGFSSTVNSNAFIETDRAYEKIQDAEKLIRIAKNSLDAVLDSELGKEISAIGITGQMHGIVYIDEYGCAVSPLYTWQDKRGDLPYKDSTYAKFWGSNTGYGGVTDFYNRENGVRPKEAICYCTVQDYFVMHLCRRKTPIIHETNSASFGKNAEHGGELSSDFAIAGEYRGIPVSVAIGDNQASVFSSLSEEGDVLINVGTGAQVSIVTDKAIDEKGIEVRPYFNRKYLLVGSALCGGRAYSMLKDLYMGLVSRFTETDEKTVYSVMGEMLSELDDSDLVADTRFAGTREDPSLKGSVIGITTENFTATHLTRAVLNGMAEELYSLYKKMACDARRIIGSGNGIRMNPHFAKVCEKRFGMKMFVPAHKEEAAFGAALYALASLGIEKFDIKNKKIIKYIDKN
ncbi:MAG: hypothetical protein E7623_01860 [Ruminococcaceae bacterium]|nr:hypothetical protein [Oscillospiraceae bacterium]